MIPSRNELADQLDHIRHLRESDGRDDMRGQLLPHMTDILSDLRGRDSGLVGCAPDPSLAHERSSELAPPLIRIQTLSFFCKSFNC